jgi:hypothetical protein
MQIFALVASSGSDGKRGLNMYWYFYLIHWNAIVQAHSLQFGLANRIWTTRNGL